ncbi:MAG: YhbY family RNA-binding protein [Oscillospiraceae bacterium]|nr:YhbY family RNA-binding protein [Oscillospiraceae bacterium]
MNTKTRAALKAQANALPALYQIGKEGVTDAVCAQVLEGFHTRELMKVKCLLKTLPVTVREAAEALAAGTGAELVQTIGGSIILHKYNPELHKPQKAAPKPSKQKIAPHKRAGTAKSTSRHDSVSKSHTAQPGPSVHRHSTTSLRTSKSARPSVGHTVYKQKTESR